MVLELRVLVYLYSAGDPGLFRRPSRALEAVAYVVEHVTLPKATRWVKSFMFGRSEDYYSAIGPSHSSCGGV
ncbi:hypothetical protein TNCV_154411 [Trichonephila clavipes]|uniref:Uncharacterized protein n=1 Tax=Trichonephila clavipes TaxID=2585209 RepID=A0A8X6WGX9_TRICX|nr:hypothetical protein TNCV_154411 [Trichonephila clavipes]